MLKQVQEWENEDGYHDLWRRTIMKFYNRVIGDRDYSLFEVLHVGLGLPATLSSFGTVATASVSNWCSVKQGVSLRVSKPDQRATNFSKLELFSNRGVLARPARVSDDMLSNISFAAFWRLFDVQNGRIVMRRSETMLAISGAGWPSAAKRSHSGHADVARRTLYAYMPCRGLRGVEYVDACVARFFNNDWGAALEDFVSDGTNCWCPPWIKRNYTQMNDAEDKKRQPPPAPTDCCGHHGDKETAATSEVANDATDKQFPQGANFRWPVVFAEAAEPADEELEKGAADDDGDAEEVTAAAAARDPWKFEDRPPWQQHSELGPNPGATTVRSDAPPLPDIVNPGNHNYAEHARDFNFGRVVSTWAQLPNSESHYSNADLTPEALGDDYQRLFVEIVLNHAAELMLAFHKGEPPPPLRLMLLGTAGTGKTRAIQTLLEQTQQMLKEMDLPTTFVRAAAPTGTAAFNIRYSATTIHRLIHWFNPRFFDKLTDDKKLLRCRSTFATLG